MIFFFFFKISDLRKTGGNDDAMLDTPVCALADGAKNKLCRNRDAGHVNLFLDIENAAEDGNSFNVTATGLTG